METRQTLAKRGEKIIAVKEAKSCQRSTVMLGVSATGEKMRPFVIFSGAENGRISRELSFVNEHNDNLMVNGFSSLCKYATQQ